MDIVYGDADDNNSSKDYKLPSESPVLEEVNEKSVKLESMQNSRNAASSSLKAMMMADELEIEMNGQPKLYEMSTKYGNSKKREEDILKKDKLNNDEKELIKKHLQEEISSKPQGFNQRKSQEMYRKLMAEQKAREARYGFFMVLILTALGFAASALTYFAGIDVSRDDISELIKYLPYTTAAFSLLMLIRSKAFRIFSLVYFIGYTIIMIGPGLVLFALTPENQKSTDYLMKLGIFAAAIVLGAIICFRLASADTVKAYYSYSKRK